MEARFALASVPLPPPTPHSLPRAPPLSPSTRPNFVSLARARKLRRLRPFRRPDNIAPPPLPLPLVD